MQYVVVGIGLFLLYTVFSSEQAFAIVVVGVLFLGGLAIMIWVNTFHAKQRILAHSDRQISDLIDQESDSDVRDRLAMGLLCCVNDPEAGLSQDWNRLLDEIYANDIMPRLQLPNSVVISDWNEIHETIKNKLVAHARQIARDNREKYDNIDRSKILQFAEDHRAALVAKRRRLIERDEFGREFRGKWDAALAEVFDDMVLPALCIQNPLNRADKIQWLDELVEVASDESPVDGFTEDMTGHDYEAFCAQCFEAAGADVVRTPGSGDDGADLIIDVGDDRRVAVQCKRQAKPVGNRAVQEVSAALKMHEAHEGVVVSASGFTNSARRTADAHGVRLLHHDEIPYLINQVLRIGG